MSIDQFDKIDFVALYPEFDEVRLIISDHLDWGEFKGEHLLALQDKLNSYMAFIETGQLYRDFPKAVGRKIVIEVFAKFPLSEEASRFYRLAGERTEEAGFSLRFDLHKAEQDAGKTEAAKS